MTDHALAKIFQERNYKWKFKDGSLRVPTPEEIDQTIVLAMEALKNEPENAQMEVGRLIIKRRGSWYDVFVHLAEIPK